MEIPRRQFLHLAAGAAALPALPRIARGQAYPSRPIRLVVPFPPGGAFDALARPWADKIRPLLGTVFIDNIGGGRPVLWVLPKSRARGPTGTLYSSEAR
jgi:tripartite-type tricarboxylate transporter receptor subunit TctC